MDGLSALLKRAEILGLVEGFEVGEERVMVTHLQFADDTILFLKAERESIRNMEFCLKIFEVISGLRVNMAKSCMVGIHVDNTNIQSLTSLIGCRVGSWPLKYLGMPLGGNPRAISF